MTYIYCKKCGTGIGTFEKGNENIRNHKCDLNTLTIRKIRKLFKEITLEWVNQDDLATINQFIDEFEERIKK